jgi:hypothetical protein
MKRIQLIAKMILVLSVLLAGCSKDADPVAAEKKAKLLAGNKNDSKTWILLSITEKVNSDAAANLDFGACFFDNLYTFYNTADQEFDTDEGATKCNVDDPELVEEGNWAFSIDGQMLIISSDNFYSFNSLFSYFANGAFPFPAEVVTLNTENMELRMVLEYGVDTIIYTFVFEAA